MNHHKHFDTSNGAVDAETLGAPESTNDNGTCVATPDTTLLLAEPRLASYIAVVLHRHGVHDGEMRDAVAEIRALALEAARRGRMPADGRGWRALAGLIAERWAIDRLRERDVTNRYDAGLVVEDPDVYERPILHREQRDPVDTERYLGVLKELFDRAEMPEHGAEILWAEAEGVAMGEVAEELGITEDAARGRLKRMRAKFRVRLAQLGMLTLALLVVMLLALGPAQVGMPQDAGPDAGTQDALRKATPPQEAAELRKVGLDACRVHDWSECLERLDAAAAIDPAGDDEPAVQAARARALAHDDAPDGRSHTQAR